jgi:hypothetical protein
MQHKNKELIILPLNKNENLTTFTGSIICGDLLVGTFQLSTLAFPPINQEFGAPFNTKYEYTLIFNDQSILENNQKNIATDSIQTNGFFQISGGVFIVTDLGLPIGNYVNVGSSPNGTKYDLVMINEDFGAKIILQHIC